MRIKFFNKKLHYFPKMYLMITSLVSIITVILALFLFISFKNIATYVISTSNIKILTSISHNTIQKQDYIRFFSINLLSNDNAVKLLSDTSISLSDTTISLSKLNSEIINTPFVYSVYFYNKTKNAVISIGKDSLIRSSESFYDKEIVTLLKSTTTKSKLHPITRIIPTSDNFLEESSYVYSYIFPYIYSADGNVQNAIVVNVKADWMFGINSQNGFEQMLNETKVMMIDYAGKVCGDSNGQQMLKNLSALPYIKKILSYKNQFGSINASIDKQSYVITYVTLEPMEWKLITITDFDSVMKPLNQIRTITILICIFMLFISFIVTFFLSKKLYSPIKKLKEETKKLFNQFGTSEKNRSEFEFISQNLSVASDRLFILQKFRNRNLDLLKQEYLKKILLNSASLDSFNDNSNDNIQIKINPYKPIGLLVFRIDRVYDIFNKLSAKDQTLYLFALTNIASEIMHKMFVCETIDMGNDHIAIIYNLMDNDDQQDENHKNLLCTLVKEIQDAYLKYYELSLTIGVGKFCNSLKELHLSYISAIESTNYRLLKNQGSIIYSEKIQNTQFLEFKINNPQINDLMEAIKSTHFDDFSNKINSIFDSLQLCNYKNIRFAISYLTSAIFNTLSNLEKNKVLSFGLRYDEFIFIVGNLDTLQEIKYEFINIFKIISAKIKESKDNKSSVIAQNIIKHIHLNYTDPNLSINSISIIFNLSIAYIGKIFRDYTFQSVSSFINDYRLIKAEEMLVKTNFSIEEIIEKISWENRNYFFTMFKKKYGTTPTQYRLQTQINRIDK